MTTEVVTLESLVEKRVELMATIGQSAADNDAKKMDAAISERRKIDKQIGDFAANAEKDARDTGAKAISESLKAIDMSAKGIFMSGVVLSGTLRRGESGIFDDLKVGVGFSGEADLSALLYSAINMDAVKDLSSVKGINFEVSREGAKVEYTGRAPAGTGGGNGTGGKGWYKDGVKHSLTDVFEARANDEDRENLEQAKNGNDPGNATHAVKNAVAKRQDDFTLGE